MVYYTNGYHIYIIDQLGYKPRRVLITMQEFMEKVVNDDLESGASAPEEEPEE